MAIVTEMFNVESYQALKVGLQANRFRQKLIASNVANIDTPGYKTRDVSFDKVYDSLRGDKMGRLWKTHSRHMDGLPGEDRLSDAIFYAYHPQNPNDGINDVDIDREMVKNNETATNFQIYADLIQKKYNGLKEVIDATP